MWMSCYLDLPFSGWKKNCGWALPDSTESLFKHLPVASREDYKLKVLNQTCACVSSLHTPNKTKKNKNQIVLVCCPWMTRKPRAAFSLCQCMCLAVSAPSQPNWLAENSKRANFADIWNSEGGGIFTSSLSQMGQFPHLVRGWWRLLL